SLSRDLQQTLTPYCNVDMSAHIPVILYLDYPHATTELHLGLNWKVAQLDELLAKLRAYFGTEALHIEYQVKSKAASAVSYAPARPEAMPTPPARIRRDDAREVYQATCQDQ